MLELLIVYNSEMTLISAVNDMQYANGAFTICQC